VLLWLFEKGILERRRSGSKGSRVRPTKCHSADRALYRESRRHSTVSTAATRYRIQAGNETQDTGGESTRGGNTTGRRGNGYSVFEQTIFDSLNPYYRLWGQKV